MAFRFTKELGTIQGAILYIQTSSDEDFQGFKQWFKTITCDKPYYDNVWAAIKERENT